MSRGRVLAAAGAALVLLTGTVAAYAATGSTATCTPSPDITTGTADQTFSVTCSVPLPAPVTSTVTSTVTTTPPPVTSTTTATVTTTVTASPTATTAAPTVAPTVATTTATPSTTTTTAAGPAGWNLVWADEFNGTTVDTTKWRVRDGDYMSYDLACIYASNVTEGGGVLTITSKRENAACNGGRSYTTGYLDTIGKASWTYGRFEMRARMALPKNASKGIWPAFWLRPNDGGNGELDVMEQYGTGTDGSGGDGQEFGQTHATIWNTYSPSVHEGNDYQTGVDTSADWHTYTMEWEPGVVRFYFDGVLNYTRDTTTTPWFASVYDQGRPFNIRLNQQVGGSWAGTPQAATTFPAAYQVDYVRVYQR